jgi:hypothetical protein
MFEHVSKVKAPNLLDYAQISKLICSHDNYWHLCYFHILEGGTKAEDVQIIMC